MTDVLSSFPDDNFTEQYRYETSTTPDDENVDDVRFKMFHSNSISNNFKYFFLG